MKIAYYAETARVDGTMRFYLRQSRWLRAHGHDAVLFAPPGPMVSAFHAANVDWIEVAGKPDDLLQLKNACAKAIPDAIVATARTPFPNAAASMGGAFPVYYNILANDYALDATETNRELIRSAAHERRIIAHTIHDVIPQAQLFGFDPALVALAPLAIEIGKIEPADRVAIAAEFGFSSDNFIVLTACRLDDEHVRYIEPLSMAVASAVARGLPWRLLVVGDGTHGRDLRATRRDGTVFAGMRDDLDRLYGCADVYCGEGTTIFEAAAQGTPVLMSCSQTLPQHADMALGLFGVHTYEHMFFTPNNVVPQYAYDQSLDLLSESEARRKVAHSGGLQVLDHSMDRYMRWFLRLVGDPNTPSLIEVDIVRKVLAIDPGVRNLKQAAEVIATSPETIGLSCSGPVAWQDLLEIEPADAQTLVRASRRQRGDVVETITLD